MVGRRQLVVAEVEVVPFPGHEAAVVREAAAGHHLPLAAEEEEAVEVRQGLHLVRGSRHQASGVVVAAARAARANRSSQAPARGPVVQEEVERSGSFGPERRRTCRP